MKSNAVKIHDTDNVVISTQPIKKGDPVVIKGERLFDALDEVDLGHKIAIAPIVCGGKVFRYGEPILQATRPIAPGEWVHVHNTHPIPGDLNE